MNVNCPGCNQGYKLDEGRIPDRGQKMRCPKCSTSFRVHRDGSTTDIVALAGAPAGSSRPSVMPKRPARPSSIPKGEALKVAATGPGAAAADGADLPAPKIDDDPFGDIDLPTPAGSAGGADLPTPKINDDPFGDIDLPTPAGSAGGADLPAPKIDDDPFGDIDLPTPAGSAGGADLPAPKSGDDPFGEIDLPSPIDAGADLPSPKADESDWSSFGGDIPAPNPEDPFGEIDLPTPSGAVDLPTPSGAVDLPTPSGAVDLPTPSGAVDLPTPSGAVDLPTPSDATGSDMGEDTFGEIDLPTGSLPPAPPQSPPAGGPPPDSREDLGAPPADPAASRQRVQGSGSTDFGEIDLSDDGNRPGDSLSGEFDEFPVSSKASDDDDLGSIDLADSPVASRPKGTFIDEAPSAQDRDGQRPSGVKYEGRRKLERQSRKLKIAFLLIVLLIGAGGAALTFTPLGPFGVNALGAMLPSGVSDKAMTQLQEKVNKRLREDTLPELDSAIKELELLRKEHQQDEDLSLMGVYLHNWHQIRFGPDKEHHAAATKLLGKINLASSESRFASLAEASGDLVGLKIPKVIQEHGSKPDLSANFLALLGEAQLLAGDFEDAAKTGGKLEKKEKSPRAAYLLARALTRTGGEPLAIKKLAKLLATNKDHNDGTLLLARLMLDEKTIEAEKIAALLEPICDLSDSQSTRAQRARAHALLGRLRFRKNEFAKATGRFDQAENLNPDDIVLLVGRGRLALFGDDLVTASSFFMRARSEDPTDIHALLGEADTMIRQGSLADAKTLLTEMLPDNEDDPIVHYLLGKVEFALKNNASAEKSLARSIGLDKEFIEPYIVLSDLYLKTGRDTLAMRTLDEASEAVPGSPLIKLSIADGHAARGDFSSAIVALDEALAMDPDNVRAHFKMAQMYRRLGSLDDAERALGEVASRNPSYPGLALEQGLLMELSGKVGDALAAYERVLAANPDDTGAKIRVAAASLLSGKLPRAKELLEEIIKTSPKSAEANYYLGEVYRLERKSTEAAIYLKNAVDLDDANPRYHLRYGMALMQLRDMLAAAKEFNRAKELDPKMAEVYMRLGEIKLRTGSARDAIKLLDKALQMDSKMAEAYGLIGEAFEELADLRSSTAYYQKAIKELPKDAKMHFKLSLNQLQAGNEKAAMPNLSRAVEFGEKAVPKPNWLPEAYFRLGVAQMNAGKKASAIASFKRYLEIAPEKALDRSEVLANLDLLQN